MSVIKKPDLKIFAQDAKTGEVETFPDILRGWGVTLDRTAGKPPLEWFNAIGKRVDEWLMYLTQRGVAEWDTALFYPKTAIVQFNSVVYVSIKETKGEQPDKSQATWSTLGVFLGLGNYYNKTESDTKFQPKGNYAPAGNYQPAGDYATNTALNNGLALKFDKIGGVTTGYIMAANEVGAKTDNAHISLITSDKVRGPHIASRKDGATDYLRHNLPSKSGAFMQIGDYGWGGSGDSTTLNEKDLVSYYKNSSNISRVFRNNADSTLYHYKYSTVAYFRTADTYSAFSADYSGKGVIAIGGNNNTFYEYYLLHSRNTTTDRNGNVKASGASDELSDCRVGIPLPWPQSTAPTGYLICNGQTFNKTTYPLLALAYPSGVLPELRGEFIRGLDAGRNIDAGRAVLSVQGDMFKAHNHSVIGEDSGSGTGFFGRGNGNRREIAKNAMNTEGGNETRPRNIAFLYIVRAA